MCAWQWWPLASSHDAIGSCYRDVHQAPSRVGIKHCGFSLCRNRWMAKRAKAAVAAEDLGLDDAIVPAAYPKKRARRESRGRGARCAREEESAYDARETQLKQSRGRGAVSTRSKQRCAEMCGACGARADDAAVDWPSGPNAFGVVVRQGFACLRCWATYNTSYKTTIEWSAHCIK